MKAAIERSPQKKESQVTANSDGSSSTVSLCDVDMGEDVDKVDVDENEKRNVVTTREQKVPIRHFKRCFKYSFEAHLIY